MKMIRRIIYSILTCFIMFLIFGMVYTKITYKKKYETVNNTLEYELNGKVLNTSVHKRDTRHGLYFRVLSDSTKEFKINEDYFIIGYVEASQILKDCDYSEFSAIQDLIQLENDHFGESYLKPEDINSEKVVNLLAYFYGFEVMNEIIEEFEE